MEKREERIYLDYAATTYVKKEVLEKMMPFFQTCAGNPSGLYASGREARRALEDAREEAAACLHAGRDEIYFTSGGTESNNWALRGMITGAKKHIVTTAAEHHAVLDVCRALQQEGSAEVTILPVDEYGTVCARQIAEALREDTALVSVLYANNEVGSINPIAEIGETVRERGISFHTDAVAAAGHLSIDVQENKADLLSISAHKFYGPKGVGILYCRKGIKLHKLLYGGRQEMNMRPGTEQVQGAAGLAAALCIAQEHREREEKRLAQLRAYMVALLKRMVPGVRFMGHPKQRLAGNVHILLPEISSVPALMYLDRAGIECSAGSACESGAVRPSHVLLAMGVPETEAKHALRFTFGAGTTKEQLEKTVQTLAELCAIKKA